MKKSPRHYAIKEIISTKPIENQEQLCQELKKRNIDITQATLSRDLSELGVTRFHTKEGTHYSLREDAEDSRILSLIAGEVTSIRANEVMIIVRTLPGRAPGVASFIDTAHDRAILGTVAGDDTVLVLPAKISKTHSTMLLLKKILIDSSPH